MPAKQPNDLTEDQFVAVRKVAIVEGPILEITISIRERQNTVAPIHPLKDEKKVVFAKSIDELSNRAGVSQVMIGLDKVAWMVQSSNASEPGWGPFLYDIAMELATLAGAGLRSHDSNVSEQATKVWNFYFSNRSDVSKQKLPRKLEPQCRIESLQFMYRKSPDTTVQQLKEMGKWHEWTSVINSEEE